MNCIACRRRLKFLGKNENWDILQCPSCGLGTTTGRFPKTQYSAYPKGTSFAYHRDPVYIKEEEQLKNIFKKRVGIILKFRKMGIALEVGSSTGAFLSLLKEKGWEVQGVEPSLAAGVAEKNGTPTLNTTFEKAELKDGTFDLVIFNHVLEHMENPLAVLQKARAILKKDGILFIDVPNFASLAAKLYGVGWKYVLPEEHKWHFTKDSLDRLLKKADFEVMYWETRSGIWDYGNPGQEVWQSLIGGKKRFFTNLLTSAPAYIVGKLGLGSGLTIVARKVR